MINIPRLRRRAWRLTECWSDRLLDHRPDWDAQILRLAVIRERVVVTALWAHQGADAPDAWWDAACEVDHLIDELEARGTR